MAELITLYSGSSGNCTMIRDNERYILIDMGKSTRKTMASLQALHAPIENLSGIFITHEHSDHVGGLAVFLKKNDVPVYASTLTLDYLYSHQLVPATADLRAIDKTVVAIDGFSVQSFATNHDAVDCHGYRITTQNGSVAVVATDLGYVSEQVLTFLERADVVSLESNYDYSMLMVGRYPYYLKRRVSSNSGHLSNEDCAKTIMKLYEKGCKKFMLCHISEENNTPLLALENVKATLLEQYKTLHDDCVIQVAHRHDIAQPIIF